MVTKATDIGGALEFVPQPLSAIKAGMQFKIAPGQSVPDGWLECDGSAISRTTYSQLFAAIGTSYGVGDGSTTFNLPNGPRRTYRKINIASYVSSLTNGGVLSRAFAQSHQDAKGQWYTSLYLEGSKTNNTTTVSVTFTASSMNFSETTWAGGSYFTANSVARISAPETLTTGDNPSAYANFYAHYTDVPCSSKPGYIQDLDLECIPVIAVYDNSSNISMSLADATATKTGAVRLNAGFAAGDGVYGFAKRDIDFVESETQYGFRKLAYARSALKTDQSGLTSAVETKVGFTVNNHAENITWDNVNKRFIPQIAGWYEISGTVFFNVSAGNNLRLASVNCRKNGDSANYLNNQRIDSFGNTTTGIGIQASVPLSFRMFFNGTTDYVEIYATGFTSSGTWNIGSGSASVDQTFVFMNII